METDRFGFPSRDQVLPLIRQALAEDLPGPDITSMGLFSPDERAEGVFQVKGHGVLAGTPIIEMVFAVVDPDVSIMLMAAEGDVVKPGQLVARARGPIRALLAGERVSLNFLQHLSGVATATAEFVKAVADTQCRITDTRKTTPGLRALEKYAVRVGGGSNHRFSLTDAAMVKDNHLALCRDPLGSLKRLRRTMPHTARMEVEVSSIEQARVAVEAGADIVLLDNMSPEAMTPIVKELGHRVVLEASGGITLESVRQVAETGVAVISVGRLTHSARSLDISFEAIPTGK